jgi:hypothetical protein
MAGVDRKAWFLERKIAGAGGELVRKNGVFVDSGVGVEDIEMGSVESTN